MNTKTKTRLIAGVLIAVLALSFYLFKAKEPGTGSAEAPASAAPSVILADAGEADHDVETPPEPAQADTNEPVEPELSMEAMYPPEEDAVNKDSMFYQLLIARQTTTAEDFERWLAGLQGDPGYLAEAKAMVGLLTDNPDLLREAIQADPYNPKLLYLGAYGEGFTDQERLSMSEEFYRQDETNALSAYVYAGRLFEAGRTEEGFKVLAIAADRPRFDRFIQNAYKMMDEALRGAGYPDDAAKARAFEDLPRPFDGALESIMTALTRNAPQTDAGAVDENAAAQRRLIALLGERLASSDSPFTIQDRLRGWMLQQEALEGLPDDAASPFEGLSMSDALESITADIGELSKLEYDLKPDGMMDVNTPLGLMAEYIDRVFQDGDVEALKWLAASKKELEKSKAFNLKN